MRNIAALAVIVLSLTACGGGGGSSDQNLPPAPGSASDDAKASATASTVIASLARKIGGVGGKSRKALAPCPDGGSVDSRSETRQVGSPFTDDAFDVTVLRFAQCEQTDADGNQLYFDGPAEAGQPVSDPRSIFYAALGDGSEDLFFGALIPSEGVELGVLLDGFLDSKYDDPAGSFDLRYDLFTSVLASVTEAGNPTEASFATLLGSDEAPFRLAGQAQSSGLRFTVDGDFAYSSDELPPECAFSQVRFATLEDLVLSGGQLTAGRLSVTLDSGLEAIVQYNADGSSSVTVNGQTASFSPAELQTLDESCSQGLDYLGFTLDIASAFQ
ncbi:MAG: hypothetical protein ACLGI7_16700 [Gammaproteobacteria bacterium]